MCVYSMVMDHYKPIFEPWVPNGGTPVQPYTPPSNPHQTLDLSGIMVGPQVAELRKLIAEFKEALEAAKKVDALTAQPDCEDPEKAKLVERVAELERRLDELKPKAKRKALKAK